MLSWNRQKTIELIRKHFDKTQLELAKSSLLSLESRRDYAYFHFKEASRLLKVLAEKNRDKNRLFLMLQKEDSKQERAFQANLVKIHAHITACLQNLHSIFDTIAYAIYLSLGKNVHPKGLQLKDITLDKVAKELGANAELSAFAATLSKLKNDTNPKYLDALVNHGKHRSLVKQVLWSDLTGNRAETHDLKFESFEYKGVFYFSHSALPFIEIAIDLLSEMIVLTGENINTYLSDPHCKFDSSLTFHR